MTISLEQLADGSVSDRNFQKLMSLMVDTGGQSVGVRFGTGTWTWPGGQAASSAATVTHGLGRTPIIAFAISNQDQGVTEVVIPETFSKGATTFQTKGVFKAFLPAAAATATFDWFAIG